MKLKKIIALFLAILMLFGALSISSYASNTPEENIILPRSTTIASAVFRDFYSYSGGATVTLSRGCNYVSFKVTCSSGTDSVYARITDLTNGAYNKVLPFPADGSTTTFETYFGAGSYSIEIYASNMHHTLGLVAFST